MFVQIHCAYVTVIITNNKRIPRVITCIGKQLCLHDCDQYFEIKAMCHITLPIDSLVEICDIIVLNNTDIPALRERFHFVKGFPFDKFFNANLEKIRQLALTLTSEQQSEIKRLQTSLRAKKCILFDLCRTAIVQIDERLNIDDLDQEKLTRIVDPVKSEVSLFKGIYEQLASYCGLDFSALGDWEVVIEA